MWARCINAALGIWLMAAPAILGYDNPAQTHDRIVGPLIATVAIVGIWEVTRGLRWINFAFGCWLLFVPLVLGYGWGVATWNSLGIGALVALFACFGGRIEGRFGGGWTALWR